MEIFMEMDMTGKFLWIALCLMPVLMGLAMAYAAYKGDGNPGL